MRVHFYHSKHTSYPSKLHFVCAGENNELYSIHLKAITQPAIVRYADYLKAFYRSMSPFPRYKWPQTPTTKKPFNLRLLDVSSTSSSQSKEQPISLHCLVQPPEGCDKIGCVFVQGVPGIGKSCLTVQLCRHWHDIDRLNKFPLVMLVRAQEKTAQEAKTLNDLFVHSNAGFTQAVVQEVTIMKGEGILIVLDGLDQVSLSPLRSVLLEQILEGKCLPNATLLITTRTNMTSKLMSLCKRKVDRLVELIGFTQDEIEQHAESSLGFDSTLLSGFHDYLSVSPIIQGALHVPLSTAIAVEAYKEARSSGESNPTTFTELYMTLANHLLQYHLLLQGEVDASYVFTGNLETLPAKVYTQFVNLAKHAFNTLLKENSSWTKLYKNQYHLSFMLGIPELHCSKRTTLMYNFTNVHVQEFLAAHHVKTLSAEEQTDLYQKYFNKPRFGNLWRFFASIDKLQSPFWDEAKAEVRESKALSSAFLQCVFEAHKDVPLESIINHPVLTFPNKIGAVVTALDCYQLGCCLAHSTCTLDLRQRLNTEMLHHLALGLSSKLLIKSTMSTLFLRPPITTETIEELRNLPLISLEGLDVSHCNLDKDTTEALAEALYEMTSLKQMDIRGNKAIGEGGMVKVLSALSTLKSLEELNLINTGMRCEDINALNPLLSEGGHLRILKIGDENQPQDSVSTLLQTTFTSHSLHSLHIWLTDLEPHSSEINTLLSNEQITIKTLEFHGCKIGQDGSCAIAEGMAYNYSLERLVCSMFDVPSTHHLTNDGALALAEMLKVNTKLTSLEISFDRTIDRKGALALMCALEHNKTLNALKIPQQNFTMTEMSVMDPRIEWA